MLLVFSGLPGTGKTTLARRLAGRLRAAYLRIDTIEEALAEAGGDVGPLGYHVAFALAADNLATGIAVVADAVNPVEASRSAWRDIAGTARVPILQLEIVCSDPAEHRRRVEARLVGGKLRPTWDDVTGRVYEPWIAERLCIDTAGRMVEGCLADIFAALGDESLQGSN